MWLWWTFSKSALEETHLVNHIPAQIFSKIDHKLCQCMRYHNIIATWFLTLLQYGHHWLESPWNFWTIYSFKSIKLFQTKKTKKENKGLQWLDLVHRRIWNCDTLFRSHYHFDTRPGTQSFTSLMADLCQDIKRVSWLSRYLNGTFPWRNCSIKTLVH